MSLLTLIKGMLIKKKKINLLIAIILIFCFATIFASIITIKSTSNTFNEATNRQKSLHDLALLDFSNYQNHEDIKNWFNENEYVEFAQISPGSRFPDYVKVNDENVIVLFQELALENNIDNLIIKEGEVSEYPDPFSLWIPTGFSKRYNIEIGDEILIPNGSNILSYKVSAIVYDPMYSSTMISPSRVWIRPGELVNIKSLNDLQHNILTIRYLDPNYSDLVWSQFSEWSGQNFIGIMIKYSDYKLTVTMSSIIIIVSLLFVGSILLFVSVIVIYFVLSSEISSSYKDLGVLISNGFSSFQLRAVNLFNYLLLLLIGTPISISIGIIGAKTIVREYRTSLGITAGSIPIVIPLIFSILIISAIIVIAVLISTSRINKITPSYAIRFGQETKLVNKRKTDNNVCVSIIHLMFRDIKQNLGKSIFSCFVIFSLVFILLFGNGFRESFSQFFSSTKPMSYPDTDLLIMSTNDTNWGYTSEDVYSELLNRNNYKSIVTGAFITESIYIKLENDNYTVTTNCLIGEYDDIGLDTLSGRNPLNVNEIALTDITSNETGKTIGDIVTISINGLEKDFTVTGLFQGINDLGKGIRLTYNALKQFDQTLKPNWFFIEYDDHVDIEIEQKSLESTMGGYIEVQNPKRFLDSMASPILKATTTIMIILALITLIVCSITIFNFTSMAIHKDKKNYGILIVSGFNQKSLILIHILKYFLLSTLAIIVASALIYFFMESTISGMFRSTGISFVELKFNYLILVISIIIAYLSPMVSVIIGTRKIKNLNLRELVVE